jgi:hypothetical protein
LVNTKCASPAAWNLLIVCSEPIDSDLPLREKKQSMYYKTNHTIQRQMRK